MFPAHFYLRSAGRGIFLIQVLLDNRFSSDIIRATMKLLLNLFTVGSLACVLSQTGLAQPRIVQTNSGTDTISMIDPATNKVVGEIKGIPVNHGAAAAPDGTKLYFSSEAEQTLDVVDSKTFAITKKIPLSGRPNNICISKDGLKVYVAIISEPGAIDVIDTVKLARIKTIPGKGGEHNVYVTPDGKYLVAGSVAGKNMMVFDTKTDALQWSLFDQGVRPIAFETNPDGSTKRLFVQLSNFHGFAVVDFATHKEVRRITLPDIPASERDMGPYNESPSHGLGVAPDGKSLWVTSRMNRKAYEYSLPDLKLLGEVPVGKSPDWVTFSPDSKTVYISTGGVNAVSAIDIASRKEVARIPVGESPKRNITAILR
jgi:YVTN family beta-propeller protein